MPNRPGHVVTHVREIDRVFRHVLLEVKNQLTWMIQAAVAPRFIGVGVVVFVHLPDFR